MVRGDDLVTEDDTLRDNDRVEIRPVMSGDRGKRPRPGAARAGGRNGGWIGGVMKDAKKTEKLSAALKSSGFGRASFVGGRVKWRSQSEGRVLARLGREGEMWEGEMG